MGHSKNLPSVYTIRGLRAAQGFIFLDPASAHSWLRQRFPEGVSAHVSIEVAEVVYYGGALGGASTEDLQQIKLNSKE